MITEFDRLKEIIDGSESAYVNCDCMDGMKLFPDKFFDLAIVDPPYGNPSDDRGGGTVSGDGSTGTSWNRFGQRFDRYKIQSRMGGGGSTGTIRRGIPLVKRQSYNGLSGIYLRMKTISMNCLGYQKIK